jgi:WD40 repeat protein
MEPHVVFVSYAHEDVDVRVRLDAVLKPLVRKGRLEVWADDRIAVGRAWRDEIETSLARATVAVLLVSTDFLASDYIMDVELPRIVRRRLPLVCIPVGACRWEEVDDIASVQWPLSPSRPIAAMTRDERDAALVAVSNAVAELVADLHTEPAGRNGDPVRVPQPVNSDPLAVRDEDGRLVSTEVEPGVLVGVPPLPRHFLPPRRDLAALRDLLLRTDLAHPVGLHGPGGVGKSVLAAAACDDHDVRMAHPDGLHWVSLGENPDIVAEQRSLARRLGADPTFSTTGEGTKSLRGLLADKRALIVVDDVWDVTSAAAFAIAGSKGRTLYTTRDRLLLVDLDAVGQLVNTLDLVTAVALLERSVGGIDAADRPTVERIAAQTGGVPLALSLVAGVRQSGRSWADAALVLDGLDAIFGRHQYADVFKAMRLAIDSLPASEARRYRMLAVFPEDVSVPAPTVARLWRITDASGKLRHLADLGLLSWDGTDVRFHDLQRAFLQFDADEQRESLHRQLLDAHRPARGWAHLGDDPYMWDQLMYHLELAGKYTELVSTATNGDWLSRRMHRGGAYPALSDLTRAAAVAPGPGTAGDALRVISRWAGLFRGDLSLAGTAATLTSRWPPAAGDVEEIAGTISLEPSRPLPEPSAALQRTLAAGSSVTSVAFDAEGRTLYCAGDGNSIRSWDVLTGVEGEPVTCGTGRFDTVALDPARDRAAIVDFGMKNAVRLWNIRTGRMIAELRRHKRSVYALAFSTDGRWLASAVGHDLILWDLASGKSRTVKVSVRGWIFDMDSISSLAFAPDGSALVGGGGSNAAVWEVPSLTQRTSLHQTGYDLHSRRREQVAFSQDGRTVASEGLKNDIALWDPHDGSVHRLLRGHTGPITALAFGPDNSTLASAAQDGSLRLWDLATDTAKSVLVGHAGEVHTLAFSPSGEILATGDRGGMLRLWDPAISENSTSAASATTVSSLAYSPDGSRVAIGRTHGHLQLWDLEAGIVTAQADRGAGKVTGIAFLAGGRSLAAADLSGRLDIWDTAGLTRTATLLEPYEFPVVSSRSVWTLAVAPDGRRFAIGDGKGVQLWSVDSGKPIALLGAEHEVTVVAFSPDGQIIAVGLPGGPKTVLLWDWSTVRPIRTWLGDEPVTALAWSPDGDVLAVATRNGEIHSIQLYDPRDAGERHPFTAQAGTRSNRLVFSPDGAILAGAGSDGTVRLWQVDGGSEIASIRLGTEVECVDWAPGGAALAVGFDTYVAELLLKRR